MTTLSIACVSDLHGDLPNIRAVDLLLIAGDICPDPDRDIQNQRRWLDGPFREWLVFTPAKHIVGVAGNHDCIFEEQFISLPWHYLKNNSCNLAFQKIWGSPVTSPRRRSPAFTADDSERARIFSAIPDDTTILLTHEQPSSFAEWPRSKNPKLYGCKQLQAAIDARPSIKLCVFGHVHECRGDYTINGTRYVNATIAARRRRRPFTHPPIYLSLEV